MAPVRNPFTAVRPRRSPLPDLLASAAVGFGVLGSVALIFALIMGAL